ncbi:hypothetical protein TU94_29020 [Streptomyces cyaneogriseus subsp. noncyanogenus]|uniref:Uncharacterized protein n=1 Tax=Streptomyces cyaneogriseus subsp. noncyanogenus TaxID=477245 RepID=A0A0C5G7Z2_9ACTN|nr:hypothetical protein [Streptomyces cyaneogriseus]AJP04890.1 hypothetical protein TU94_29020 [Streptomyces cyaneogriseus subsp. noncyanogenus]
MYDPNVVGLDMGYKVVGGRTTRDWAICVQVREKRPGSSLRPGELRIPPVVEAVVADPGGPATKRLVPTDVREVGRPVLHGGPGWEGWYRRPAWGGLGIGVYHGTRPAKGTMTTVRWGGEDRIISAAHVLNTRLVPGDPGRREVEKIQSIYQPSYEAWPAGGREHAPRDGKWTLENLKIGLIENGYPLYTYRTDHPGPYLFNTYDTTWALPYDRTSYEIGDPEYGALVWPSKSQSITITDIGRVPQVEELEEDYGPAYGLTVVFAGMMTAFHRGKVISVHTMLKSHNNGDFMLFRDLIRVAPVDRMTMHGDSGAILVGANGRYKGAALGTLLSSDPSSHYFARIPVAKPVGLGRIYQPVHAPGPYTPP